MRLATPVLFVLLSGTVGAQELLHQTSGSHYEEYGKNVAIVGDSPTDLEAGNRAGAGLVIGVRSGSHTEDTLRAAPHTHIVDSVADVPAVLAAPRVGGHRRAVDR